MKRAALICLLFVLCMCQLDFSIEPTLQYSIPNAITMPSGLLCPLKEGGVSNIVIPLSKIPTKLKIIMVPLLYWSNSWTLGTASIYECPASESVTYYHIVTSRPWWGLLYPIVKGLMSASTDSAGAVILNESDMIAVNNLMTPVSGIAYFLQVKTDVFIEHYKSKNMLRLRIGSVVLKDLSISESHALKLINTFKDMTYTQTIFT